jgi:hypothetical protein
MVSNPFSIFTPEQRRNIFIYIIGIMLYKFGLEYFNGELGRVTYAFDFLTLNDLLRLLTGAFITMANERFGEQRYKKIGILTGLNSAAQCIGSIVIAPLIKKRPTRTVLSFAVLTFGLISAILLIVDAATGGVLKFKTANNKTKYGNWSPNGSVIAKRSNFGLLLTFFFDFFF